jgi:hypothetical protein
MSLLSTLKSEKDVKEDGDSLGMGSYVLESGLYQTTVDLAYISVSAGGAMGINCVFKTKDGREIRQVFWVQSGDAKGNKNYYTDKDGVKHNLPGLNQANSMCQLIVGKDAHAMLDEEKTVNVWNPEEKKEMPKKVPVLTELLKQEVTLGIVKQVVDKNIKDDNGKYIPSGQTRDENEVDKMFHHTSNMTSQEIKAGESEALFIHAWKKKNDGVTRMRAKGATSGAGSAAGAAAGPAATPSLF